jgi:hypothetical protein
MRAPTAVALAALAVSACTPRAPAPPAASGTQVSSGPALALAASPEGSRIAWIGDCGTGASDRSGPPSCALLSAPAAGGEVVRVAAGLPAAAAFSFGPDGSIAVIGRRDPATGGGPLTLLRPGASPRVLAPSATALAWGPAGELAFASGGDVAVVSPAGAEVRLRGGPAAGEIAFAPAPARVVAARARGADGAPVLVLWRDLDGPGAVVARDVSSFAFSADGAWLAAVAGVVPGADGELVLVPAVPSSAGAAVTPLARSVGEFRWAAAGNRLAWLEAFDARIHAGRLAAAPPGEKPVVLGERVTAFELAPAGQALAFVRHVTEGGYAASLELSAPPGAPPRALARDAASFAFSPDGRWLCWRAGCAATGDSCALLRLPVDAGAGTAPEQLADGVQAFAFDPARADRLLLSLARRDGAGVDVALWEGGRLTAVAAGAVPGSPRFTARDGRRVAWIAAGGPHAGVRTAELP